MTTQRIDNLKTPIGDLLSDAGTEGVLLQTNGTTTHALMPLDDELVDFLVERDPRFIDSCRQIRERMKAGAFHSHDEVKRLLGEPKP